MPRNNVAWRRFIFVILIIASLALLTVTFREASSGPVHSIQQAGASILAPLQTWGAKIAEPFQDGYQWFKTLWSAHRRAERLEEELQTLKGEAIKLEETVEEYKRLQGLLDLRSGWLARSSGRPARTGNQAKSHSGHEHSFSAVHASSPGALNGVVVLFMA